ncbi:FHA domain-containing serine/threonine-protein kinase [Haloferax gibbonsii]|uniref:FHA domain-containing serine/threonine-protein kinase n=1 Tax=Haloferax gibbonsii TaxID=35746 RepID=UPI0009D9B9F4|nr:FHA domain-containing serine/threonine-protein kinase [Haloferax gibbonsii]
MTWNLSHGDIVDSRFELLTQVGSGGFATVWKAHDDYTGESIALKLPDDSSHDRSVVETRFEQEKSILRYLSGSMTASCIAHLVNAQFTRTGPYIALEYISGGDLDDLRSSQSGEVDTRSESHPLFAVAQMMAFIHLNQILHLDVKPKNIRHREDGTLALVDFNTSVRSFTGDSTLFYADRYTPPELAPTDLRNAETGAWSDVYSAGKTIHYLLTGQSYDLDETPASGLDPRSDGASCTQSVSKVIQSATKRDPAARPSDGGELLQQLRTAAGLSKRTAVLRESRGDITVEITPGDSVGRPLGQEPTPEIKLIDGQQHISEQQFRIEWDGSRWVLYDTSLNGTYINDGTGWTWILSDEGYQQQLSAGRIDRTADQPHGGAILTDGTTISPVDPEYGFELVFSTAK